MFLGSTLAAQTPAPSPSPSPSPSPAPSPAPAGGVQAGESRLQFYGFLRMDVIYDDSRPDGAQIPFFILSEPPGAENVSNFTMHPRLSRLGINFSGPVLSSLGDAKLAGKLELDWQNGGRESRAIPRFRHVYASLAWGGTTLLLGTTSDLISPLFPSANNDTLMWNVGNTGDRRPQVRLTVQPQSEKLQWSLGAALGLTGAVDQQDLDNDGFRDGETASVPNVQGRFGVTYPLGKRRLAFGVWGHFARTEVTKPVAGRTDWDGHSVGFDAEIPIGSRVMLRGEAWSGRNLGDFRGGIGQSVNPTTGEEISSMGGWAEAGLDLTRFYSLWLGYTLDSPDEDDLFAGAKSHNSALFVVNRWTVKPVVIGLDYLYWKTEYVGAPEGTDNRLNAYVIYNF
jgi:hypothetical protein